MTPRTILVTGGVRSGKSRYAEACLADQPRVTYLAPGRPADPVGDPEWAARVAAHRSRRPASWDTVETIEVAAAIRAASGGVLLDCLGTWVTGVIDALGTWDEPLPQWQPAFDERLAGLTQAWAAAPGPLVAVTNEVGWGLVSEYRSGRVFADLLGRTNQAVAAVSDQVVLMVAGRALVL